MINMQPAAPRNLAMGVLISNQGSEWPHGIPEQKISISLSGRHFGSHSFSCEREHVVFISNAFGLNYLNVCKCSLERTHKVNYININIL